MKLHALRFCLALALILTNPARAGELKVGFAEVDITPELKEDRPVWLAGYGHGRRATAVHDPIMARCAVLNDGLKSFALVGVDLVGLQLPQVDAVRKSLTGIDHLIVGSSHNHEGPDVIGIWGRTPMKRGVDDDYLAAVVKKITACVGPNCTRTSYSRVRHRRGRISAGRQPPAKSLRRDPARSEILRPWRIWREWDDERIDRPMELSPGGDGLAQYPTDR